MAVFSKNIGDVKKDVSGLQNIVIIKA